MNVRCPACGHGATEPVFTVDAYQHVRCLECGTVRVETPPSEEQLSAIYDAYDAYETYDVTRTLAVRLRAESRVRCDLLRKLGVRSVLDVGCGAGYFLDAARDSGLDAVGIEPGPAGNDAIARGHRVHRTRLQAAELGGRQFDAVSLWEVIEHVSDPLDLIEAALRHLARDGVLAFSTPSMSGLPAKLLGRRFPMINPPEHLTLLTRKGLQKLLERAGLRIQSIASFSNLKEPQALSVVRRLPFGQSAVAERLARRLAPAFVGCAKLMDRAGLGSEFEVFAVRSAR